jgi:ABC-type multidrug transport system ATPase subunit
VADRIAVLQVGELVMLDTPAALREQLRDVTVIEVHTEEMDLPTEPPPAPVIAAEHVDRPGALGVRAWRVHAWKVPEALQQVLDWLARPEGRVVFLAEQAPALQDVLALPRTLLIGPGRSLASGSPGAPRGATSQEVEAR